MAITHRARRLRREKRQAIADKWNAEHPVGSTVVVKLDWVEEPLETTTRTPVQLYSDDSMIIWLNGVRGFYHFDRVRAAATPEERSAAIEDLKSRGYP